MALIWLLSNCYQKTSPNAANPHKYWIFTVFRFTPILQMKNDSYYLIKRFDDDTLDHIRSQFDKESGLDFMDRFNRLSDEIVQLQKENVPPESEKCQQVVKEYWGLIMEFTNGDMSMLPKLVEVGNIDTATNAWEERQKIVNDYLEPALQVYFSRLGTNPFGEVKP